MQVQVNGKQEELPEALTLAALVTRRGFRPEQVVAEYNGEIIPRERWGEITLKAGDEVEILTFMGGGSETSEDVLTIGGRRLRSRLFIGTGKFARNDLIPQVVHASGAEVVTVALRRVDPDNPEENMLNYVPEGCVIMPNTSGARTAEEAVRIARLARAAGCGDWVKIEVIQDNRYLLPDNYETLRATEILAREGFVVLPYVSPDLSLARRLVEAGAAAVMPLGAPIGSNRGLQTRELIRILVEEIPLPVIVDAGIGRPSQAAEAMEMGTAAVLVNTALATAREPVAMAKAFGEAVRAGRHAFLAGLGPERLEAEASSPLTGFLFEKESA